MAGRPKDTETMTALGRFIADRCDELGLTFASLAERLGWPNDRVSYFCRREAVTVSEVREMAVALEVEIADLIALDSRSAPAK